MVKRSNWIWSVIIFLSAVAVTFVTLSSNTSPLRPLLAFWFLLVIPGMAFVQLLHLRDAWLEWPLAIALSIALDSIVATAMLYAQRWDPRLMLLILVAISLLGVAIQVAILFARVAETGRYQKVSRPAATSAGVPAKSDSSHLLALYRWYQVITTVLALSGILLFILTSSSGVLRESMAGVIWRLGESQRLTTDPAGASPEPVPTTVKPETVAQASSSRPEDIKPIEVITPPGEVVCAWNCSVTYSWVYAAPLAADQRFAIYLFSGDRSKPVLLGRVDQPASSGRYSLVFHKDQAEVPTGDYFSQVVLERTSDGAALAYGSPRRITFTENTSRRFMTSTVNEVTLQTLATNSFSWLSTRFGLIAIFFLLALLIAKEVVRALGVSGSKAFMQLSDIVIVPLLLAFGLVIILRLFHL